MANQSSRPYAVIGAQNLTASLYKSGNESNGYRYHFNITRLNTHSGQVGHWFSPTDLLQILKLTYVLTQELVSDGCLDSDLRTQVRKMAGALDIAIRAIEPSRDFERTQDR